MTGNYKHIIAYDFKAAFDSISIYITYFTSDGPKTAKYDIDIGTTDAFLKYYKMLHLDGAVHTKTIYCFNRNSDEKPSRIRLKIDDSMITLTLTDITKYNINRPIYSKVYYLERSSVDYLKYEGNYMISQTIKEMIDEFNKNLSITE